MPAGASDPSGNGWRDWSLGGRVQADAAHIDGVFTDFGKGASVLYLRRGEVDVGWRGPNGLRAALSVESDRDDGAVVGEALLAWRFRDDAADGLELRLGRFDPDFGLDPTTSSSWTVALERSPIFDLAPDAASGDAGVGLRADRWGRRHSASLGAYAGTSRDQIVGRAVMMDADADRVWQLRASIACGTALQDDGRIRTRLAMRAVTETDAARRSTLAPALRGTRRCTDDLSMALEAAWQQGRWLAQAEWLQRRLSGAVAAPRTATGQTVLLARAFHGAPRRHDAPRARFGRPGGTPGRWGHVETFVRIDRLGVKGERDADVRTLGLAWPARDPWRAAVNVVEGRCDDANDAGQTRGRGVVLRVQATF